jgi:hypothetical protein
VESVEHNVIVPSHVKPQSAIKSYIKRPKRASKTRLLSNSWRLIDSEFDKLNLLFSFSIEACCDREGENMHGILPFYSEKDSFLAHEMVQQSVFCNPPWSLVVQCVEHLRKCHAKSPTNTYAVIVLPEWPQFKYVTTNLKFLEQIPIDTPVFTKPSPLGIMHNLVKVHGPINYWVIDKDTPVKVPSTHVQSVSSPIYITNNKSQSGIASHWLPSAAVLNIMDPNEPETLLKLPIFIEYCLLRYDTSVLIDTVATLTFVSQEF